MAVGDLVEAGQVDLGVPVDGHRVADQVLDRGDQVLPADGRRLRVQLLAVLDRPGQGARASL